MEAKHSHRSSSDTFHSRSSHEDYLDPSSQDYRPSSSQDYHPSSAQEYLPTSSQDYRPSSSQDYLPSSSQDYLPSSAQDYQEGSLSNNGGGCGGVSPGDLRHPWPDRQSTLPSQRSTLMLESYVPARLPPRPALDGEGGGGSKHRSFTLPRDSGLHAILAAAGSMAEQGEPRGYRMERPAHGGR